MSSLSDNRLILCGASVRSLAESAIHAGFFPICLDFFGDSDLRGLVALLRSSTELRLSPVGAGYRQLTGFDGVLAVTREIDSAVPCVWAGGLENYPAILEALALERPVLGASPAAIRRVRDPRQLSAWLSAAGCLFPATRIGAGPDLTCGLPVAPNARWLLKSLRGSGGHGVEEYRESCTAGVWSDDGSVLQQSVPGIPMSATFLATPKEICLIGCTLQLCGWHSLGSAPFRYCGNWGPVRPPASVIEELVRGAAAVSGGAGLIGIFGVDFVLGKGVGPADQRQPARPWILEVNPRMTAAHELFEFSAGVSLLSAHVASFRPTDQSSRMVFRALRPQGEPAAGNRRQMLRMIAYARRDIEITPEFLSRLVLHERHGTASQVPPAAVSSAAVPTTPSILRLSDLPSRGSRIAAGHPVCSVYFAGEDGSRIPEQIESVAGSVWSACGLHGREISRQFVRLQHDFCEAITN